MSVAMVIPEMGFDELPMRPVMRDDTVTKKKPKTHDRGWRRGSCLGVGIRGASARKSASSSEPTENDRQRQVALGSQPRIGRARARAELPHAFAEG